MTLPRPFVGLHVRWNTRAVLNNFQIFIRHFRMFHSNIAMAERAGVRVVNGEEGVQLTEKQFKKTAKDEEATFEEILEAPTSVTSLSIYIKQN